MAAAAKVKDPAAPAVQTQSKAKYVTVASKLPQKLEIQLCRKQTGPVAGRHGTTDETIYVKHGDVYTLNGTAYPNGQPPKGFPRRPDMIEDDQGGFAITKNIPADFMAAWMEQNADTEMVKNGIIKVQPDLDSLADDAKEHAKLDSGLGALNPDSDEKGRPLDRRSPQPISAGISAVKAEPRTAAH